MKSVCHAENARGVDRLAGPRTSKRTSSVRADTCQGIPIYCVLAVLLISLLAFLQVSNASATVLSWFVNLITVSQLINLSVVCATILFWRRALAAQGISRDSLPYRAIAQPFAAYLGLICCSAMAFVGGYTVFLPGNWDVPTFLFSYFMIGLFSVHYVGWKICQEDQKQGTARS
jgi:amino acid transporter